LQLIDGRPVYSATDLVGSLACGHLADLERSALAGLVRRPDRPDPQLDRIRVRGQQHELRYLQELEAQGRTVTDLKSVAEPWTQDRGAVFREKAAATRQAILRGDDVIYQACFFDGHWLGFADFLLRVSAPSGPPRQPLGWSYEVADTKLARTAKASALLQMCTYVEQLTAIQGVQPEWMHVVLGGTERTRASFRVDDHMAYYRTVKRRFEAVAGADLPTGYPPPDSYPDPVEHCDICRWWPVCSARRRADDDVSLVAGLAGRTRRELGERGIRTRRGLADLPVTLEPPLERTGKEAFARVRDQARIQVAGEDQGGMLSERLPAPRLEDGSLDTRIGLLCLPQPRPGDLFLDLEGDPFVDDEGIDYLFGVLEPGRIGVDGLPTYHSFWSRDANGRVTRAAEKLAFERTVDLIIDRLDADPTIHVYHFAPYEPTALGRLMGRHTTREVEVDRLFRGDTLVDLYRVVRQGIRASVESYSIKRLEPLYGYTREVDLRDAGSSIVAFETWLEVGGETGADDGTLQRLERYNRDDVVSTLLLRDWLEGQRRELGAEMAIELPRPAPVDGQADEELAEWLRRVREVAQPLLDGVPEDPVARTPAQHGRWLLAQLLGWHRREAKAAWWLYFHLLLDLTDDERFERSEPIARIILMGAEDEARRRYRYAFPPQLHDLSEGRDATDPEPGVGGRVSVVSIDDVAGQIVLQHPRKRELHHPTSLVPDTVVRTDAQEESLLRIGRSVIEHGMDGLGPYQAARDLLMRRHPRTGQLAGLDLKAESEPTEAAARRLALPLDGTCLPIQGPPGSGKTHTGARMILDLVRAGRRVGVTANSHKVIGHLLDAVWEAALQERIAAKLGRELRIGQKPASKQEGPTCPHAQSLPENDDLLDALSQGGVDVAGATAWAWAREDFQRSVDVLVVDEAGQFSLANAVAVAPAADSLILLGDPQQLDQPVAGTHPPGAERSALAHLLEGQETMPADRGLFLERTWRLHPAICDYTSEIFYTGKLLPQPGNELQDLRGAPPADGVGLRWVPVEHTHRDSASPEEAVRVRELVRGLLEAEPWWVDWKGARRVLGPRDILVVTPYNDQRGEIERELRRAGLEGLQVGTVDKFQGQQAPLSIYSMATSSPDLAPRGMEFLYSLNRLNVATSRARCLAIVVASPQLLEAACQTPRQMRLANALCRAVEVAGGQVRPPACSVSARPRDGPRRTRRQ
jgi:uncharacterized protein